MILNQTLSHPSPLCSFMLLPGPTANWIHKTHIDTYFELYFCRLMWQGNPVHQSKTTVLHRNSYLPETNERRLNPWRNQWQHDLGALSVPVTLWSWAHSSHNEEQSQERVSGVSEDLICLPSIQQGPWLAFRRGSDPSLVSGLWCVCLWIIWVVCGKRRLQGPTKNGFGTAGWAQEPAFKKIN